MPYTTFTYGDPAIISPTFQHWFGNFEFSNGVQGVAYEQKFDMPVGLVLTPTTYSITVGSLPTGLSITNIIGNAMKISGIPSAAGTYTFTLRATSPSGTLDKEFTIVIVEGSGGGGSPICVVY